MSCGRRESQWLVLRRCLAVIRRVQRGPASWEELIQAVLAQEGSEAYGGAGGRALRRRLENDLRRIREKLAVGLYFDRSLGGYVLRDSFLPLLDLPDKDLATIAWLEETFGHDSPKHDEVHGLLGRLRFCLAPERRAVIERCHTVLRVNLKQRDEDEILLAVREGLTKALVERRKVEFDYLSPQYEDGLPRHHIVDPYEQYFDTTRGHYYLYGWCQAIIGPEGRSEPCEYIRYRLGRISNLKVLPQKLPPFPPPARRYAVVYELAPQVARLGITHHPEILIRQIERREDGSALVQGETESLFFAVQTLLHYGPTCRVLGGPEMLQEMQEMVRKMSEIYNSKR